MDKKVMYNISYGLYLLSACEDGKDNACVINTAIQVTTKPNRITITVNKENLTHDMVMRTGLFNLSFLTTETPFEVIQHFGMQSGRDAAKFGTPNMLPRSENNLCYIPTYTNAFLSGKVISTIDLGTHTMFLADVTDGEVLSKEPSLTYADYQARIKPRPAKSGDAPKKGFRCKVCGYEYEGELLPEDFICPLCKHGVDDFEPIQA